MSKFHKISLGKEDTCMIELPDGSNLTLSFRKGEPNQIEINAYTSTEDGYLRTTPVIHMVNANTLGIEFRKIKEI